MKGSKMRSSNFELLRIISMFLIVLWHTLVHGKVLDNTTSILYYILSFLSVILIVHVNSYVLVTGYFQSKSKFKIKKIINLAFEAFFIKILVYVILDSFNLVSMNSRELFEYILPFGRGNYWFINIYIMLYMFSPFINILINNLDLKKYRMLLITMFIFCSVFTNFNGGIMNNISGYSLLNFIFLYLIGAYIRKCNDEDISIFKKDSKLFYLLMFFVFVFLNFLLVAGSHYILRFGGDFAYFGKRIGSLVYQISNEKSSNKQHFI